MPQEDIGAAYLADALRNFRSYKKLAEEALAQTSDEDVFRLLDKDANSIAMLIKHMAGNMRSRWIDFLTTDGEKPDRHRDREFEIDPGTTRAEVMKGWEEGWGCVFEAITPLKPEDLLRIVLIAGREHTVLQAISRQLLSDCPACQAFPRGPMAVLEYSQRAIGDIRPAVRTETCRQSRNPIGLRKR